MNTRPQEDLAERELYRQSRPLDELAKYFPVWDRGWVTVPLPTPVHIVALDTPAEHVYRAFGIPRYDKLWNMVRVCWHIRNWCHANPWDGRILCVRLKLDKGEWSDEADRLLRYSVLGKIECHEPRLEWVQRIRESVIDDLKKREAA